MKQGVLLYGFEKHDAEDLKTQIEHAIASPVMAWGAPPDDETVLPILEETAEGQFEDAPDRCVMFVGFEGSEIQKVLRSVEFPPPVSPLFCCPTETNVTWPFRELIEHLKEEREGRKTVETTVVRVGIFDTACVWHTGWQAPRRIVPFRLP